jgi:hypothetical protein
MAEIVPFQKGMERKAEGESVDSFVMSSLADFIAMNGCRPTTAVVMWIDDDGEAMISQFYADNRDLAYFGAQLTAMALT